MKKWPKFLGFSLVWLFLLTDDVTAQPPIVLRDLTLLRDKAVSDFDDTGVVLSDGSKLGWDRVLIAPTEPDRQSELDRRIVEIGLPLFRLKMRIKNSDWAGAGEIAERFLKTLDSDTSFTLDVDTIYLVHLAAMKSQLQSGNRSEAVWNFVQAATLQTNVSPQALELVATSRLPDHDTRIQFSQEILPIWFDLEKLGKTVDQLTTLTKDGQQPTPGLAIYLASMKIELGQIQSALDLIKSLDSKNEEMESWRVVLESRIERKAGHPIKSQTMLEQNASSFVGGARPVAIYYRGIAVLDYRKTEGADDPIDVDRSNAILMLLRIPALYGDTYRHLSAAALFQSAEIAKLRELKSEEQKLRDELLRRYPRTYHGSQKTIQISK